MRSVVIFENIARRINFQSACEFTRGEVFESEMVINVSQLLVTDVRIQLVRQLHLTNSSFDLVTFELADTEAENAPGEFPQAADRVPARD